MASFNETDNKNPGFVLNGFPGIQDWKSWLSVLFALLFILTFFGNLTILCIVATEERLHEPMHYFISILAAIDLVPGIALLPKLLVILWFDMKQIQFDECFMQMFIISFSLAMESSLLVLMAYDRYIAVCKPLTYSSIVTDVFMLKNSIFIVIRSFFCILPAPILARALPYCGEMTVQNAYCEYFAVTSVACTHTAIGNIYLFILMALVPIPDAAMIGLSYYMIVRAILKLKSREGRQKAFSTCSSHVLVIASFYVMGAMSFLVSLLESKMPPFTRALFSVLYITIPSTLNPVIYGIKTKEIRVAVINQFRKSKLYQYVMANTVTKKILVQENGNKFHM
ncbi:olfactory receptor 56A5-like [Protopterus annectens]|uniref:olfactory receptor 56A5-like n=1 Tax=Protopterus annectens TaxID=7888 RepID=UPI001CFB6103|nr:olfactory receptor 56A5-like [Protopterus annectens]